MGHYVCKKIKKSWLNYNILYNIIGLITNNGILFVIFERSGNKMAKTKSSTRGVQNKKIVVVKEYIKKDGTKVTEHRRSTPN